MKAIAAVLLVLLLTACNGGTVDRHALTNDSSTIDSINCESWLLSRAAERGRSTSTFTREQAAVLAVQASNLADALRTRPVADHLEARVRARARGAAALASRLRVLHAHPADRSRAAALARLFKNAGHCT